MGKAGRIVDGGEEDVFGGPCACDDLSLARHGYKLVVLHRLKVNRGSHVRLMELLANKGNGMGF